METKVVIGAGEYSNNPGWLETQESELNVLKEEDWASKFEAESLSALLAEHVWEHLTYEEGVKAARHCYTYLKKGGHFRCAVPDGFFPDEDYQRMVQVGGPGPKDHPAASHKIVYNYRTLTTMLEEAGFKVKLLEYCDEQGDFHFNDWDKEDGLIFRSKRFDPRNVGEKPQFVSLIVDAVKTK